MKLTWPKGNQLRFNFDINTADDPNNIPFTIEPSAAYGISRNSIGIICRWRVYALNKDNEEVLGFLYETESTIVEFGNKETDLAVLVKFCSDSFINVEMNFQNTLKLPYNIFGTIRPDFYMLGLSLLSQLDGAGYYHE